MRWQKGKDFLEIAETVSTDHGVEVWYIETNINFCDLPIVCKGKIPKTDTEGFNKLKQAVSSWAQRNKFELI